MAHEPAHLLDRLADKFTVGDDCWEWTAYRRPDGYGEIYVHGRGLQRAHRVLYELLVGPIPEGLTLDHLCRNRGCVRPAHLEPVTRGENVSRGVARNAKKTHCPQGHPYDQFHSNGQYMARRCSVCHQIAQRRYREKQRGI